MTFTIIGKHRWPRVVGLLVALPLLTAGCFKATGGGWIPSAMGADKANFGFTARCADIEENGVPAAKLYDGQLEWQDGPVRLHGIVGPAPFFLTLPGRCKDVRQMLIGNAQQFNGTYQPQLGGASGFFFVTVIDNGTPGANGDFIQIQLVDGLYNGYFNEDFLQGGNIQVF